MIDIETMMSDLNPYILTGVSFLLIIGMAVSVWLLFQLRSSNRNHKSRIPWIPMLILAGLGSLVVNHVVQIWWQQRLLDELEHLPSTAAGPELQKGRSMRLFKPLLGEVSDSLGATPAQVIQGRTRSTAIELDAMRADILELDLFDDTTFKAIRDHKINGLVPTLEGGQAWIGHVENEPESEVIFVAQGSAVSGTIDMGSRTFEVVYVKDGIHSVREINTHQLPKTFEPDSNAINNAFVGEQKQHSPQPSKLVKDRGEVIDILVAYTPKTRINAGGVSAIEARILNAVLKTQQVYNNSRVNVRLNVLRISETDYAESEDMALTHTRLVNPEDGYLDDLPLLRDEFGADVVILFSAEKNYCGVAPLMVEPVSGFQSMAYIVVHDDSTNACLGGNDALAHAFGHLHGVAHELEDSSAGGIEPDAHGYRICGVFRDVMSSGCQNEPRVSIFSNPEVQYMGQPAGVTGAINAARAILVSAPLMANFRHSPATTRSPKAPARLRAHLTPEQSIELNWSDESNNETGFTLYRSTNGFEWQAVATLASNHGSYLDTSVEPNATYQYRLEAWNSVGSSGYTNPVEAQTFHSNAITEPYASNN